MISRWQKFKKSFYIVVTIMAFLCVCGVLAYKTQGLKNEEARVDYELARVEEQYAGEQERTVRIDERKAYVQTKKFAEEVARQKFGMVYKDEIIFTPKINN